MPCSICQGGTRLSSCADFVDATIDEIDGITEYEDLRDHCGEKRLGETSVAASIPGLEIK